MNKHIVVCRCNEHCSPIKNKNVNTCDNMGASQRLLLSERTQIGMIVCCMIPLGIHKSPKQDSFGKGKPVGMEIRSVIAEGQRQKVRLRATRKLPGDTDVHLDRGGVGKRPYRSKSVNFPQQIWF